MKKRLLSVLLCLCMVLMLFPAEALARSDTDTPYAVTGGNIYFDEATGTITGCDPYVTAAEIPSAINGVAVTSIGDGAFSCCDRLTSITIPDSVTSIGDGAFSSCNSLTGITIPDGVTSIGDEAFFGCSGLTDISVESENPNYASEEGVLVDKHKSILICYPARKSNSSYAIPDSVTSIGDGAFRYCESLTSITIPDSVTSIGDWAFAYCYGLSRITIPDSVTSIGGGAFRYCNGLTSITIPDSVTSIGNLALEGCSSLTSITIPDSVTSIGDSAFFHCDRLTDVHYAGSESQWGDITIGGDNEPLISATIHYDSTGPIEQVYAVTGGNLYFDTATGTITGCDQSVIAAEIPNAINGVAVTSIGYRAFYRCDSLASITIPDGVTCIGDSAFYSCSGLTSVTIPDSVTSIGDSAFQYCDSLTSITIPDGVTSIEDSAFSSCSSLASITIPDSVTSIGDSAFWGCSGLTDVTIPDSVTSIGDSAFCLCNSLTSITIPDGVTSIGDSAFYSCDSLTSITIPDGVTSIGDEAFMHCSRLISVTIPDSVTSIGDRTFYGCGPTSITIPDSVTSIGAGPFSGCRNLTGISVDPENPNYASEDGVLFDKQKSILICCPGGKSNSSYAISDSVTSIGDYAFCYYDGLTSITIPDSVTSIGDFAFYGCYSLTDVYYAGSESQWEEIIIGEPNDPLISAAIHYNSTGPVDPPAPARTYTVTVNGGTGSGDYEVGEDVTITAIVPDGQEFTGWIVDEGDVTLADPGSEETTFTMPESNVTVTATYEDIATPPDSAQTYTVAVNGGTGGGRYEVGETVTIKAIVPDGQEFTGWIVEEGGVTLADPDSEVTTFTMPEGNVTVTATYEEIATPPAPTQIYTVTVNGGTGGGRYKVGETVTIKAVPQKNGAVIIARPEGLRFTGWIVEEGDVTLADPDSEVTTFIMPARDVMVTATYEDVAYTITFDPNGGTGTMDDEQVNEGGTFIFPVCGFTAPAGKEFKAWSVDGQEYAPGDTYTVTGDITVTALWKAILPDGYTLTGTITGHKGVTYTSVTAQLVGLNGSVYSAEVGDGVTNKTGKTDYFYAVTAPAGQYSLEVEARTDAGGVVNRTALVKLAGSGQTKDVNLPNGQAKVTVNNTSSTAVLVGGLDELIIDADGEVRGEVALTIDSVDESSPDAAAIQSAASGQTLEFMDISIIKSVDGAESAVTDTGDVTIQIVLTFDCTGKRDIAVYRYHGGSVDALTTQASGDGERIEVDDDSIAIYAKKFSVYAIGYTVSAGEPVTPSNPTVPSNPTAPSQPGGSNNAGDNTSDDIYYSISVPAGITGGAVAVSPKSAAKGSTVTLTVTADEGYELASLTAADSKGNELELTAKGNGKYTFTMPGSAVTVSAVFKLMEDQPATPTVSDWVNPFTDVTVNAWYYDAVKFVSENGLMNGSGNNLFEPNANLSRAQLAQILYIVTTVEKRYKGHRQRRGRQEELFAKSASAKPRMFQWD